VATKDLAKRRLESTLQAARDHRHSFLKSCKEFRRQLHQMSVQAECLGLPPLVAPLTAYSVLHPTTVCNAGIALLLNAAPTPLEPCQSSGVDDDNVPVHINSEERSDDEEMRLALNELDELRKSREVAQLDLEVCREKRSNVHQAQEKRDLQEQNLRSQLDKLEQDLQSLRSQIESVRNETDETRQMTLVFQTGNCCDGRSFAIVFGFGSHLPIESYV
jgi:hypothetical protein